MNAIIRTAVMFWWRAGGNHRKKMKVNQLKPVLMRLPRVSWLGSVEASTKPSNAEGSKVPIMIYTQLKDRTTALKGGG